METDLVLLYKDYFKDSQQHSLEAEKYFFSAVTKNLTFINRFFIIIPDDEQLPSWLDTAGITIVRYSDFIPDNTLYIDLLTVRLFLHNIAELSEHFIVATQDIFAVKSLSEADFFMDDKPMISFIPTHVQDPQNKAGKIYWQQNLYFYKKFINKDAKTTIKRVPQTFMPYTKTAIQTFWTEYSKEILASLKDGPNASNWTECALLYWALKNNYIIDNPEALAEGRFMCLDKWFGILNYDLEHNNKRKVVYLVGSASYAVESLVPNTKAMLSNILDKYIGL